TGQRGRRRRAGDGPTTRMAPFAGGLYNAACLYPLTRGGAMRRIAIINQKGGVGKTTTAVNLAAALAQAGQRVCVLDLDPQAHATTHLGIEPDGKAPSMYDVLIDSRPLAEVRQQVGDRLWVAGSDINLAAAEVELAGVVGREVILRDLLLQDEGDFDFVFM